MPRVLLVPALVLLAACAGGPQASILFDTAEPEVAGDTVDGSLLPADLRTADDATLEKDEADTAPPCATDADCDDGDACTKDSCDLPLGCRNIPLPGGCDDGIECTVDSCDPASGCVNAPDPALCDDGIDCTIDECTAGGCLHTVDNVPCDDGNPCTQEWCDPQAGCTSSQLDGACNDQDPCTGPDWCDAGTCTGPFVLSTACLYTDVPNVGACKAGAVTMSARNAAMARVNEIRTLVGIPPVVYDTTHDSQAQQAALIMAANAGLNHTPPKEWYCWSQAGYDGASSSNLHLGLNTDGKLATPAEVVDAFLVDLDVETLGHRRWILDPFLTRTSYGFVSGQPKVNLGWPYSYSGTLRVIDDIAANLSSLALDFVAYPIGNFPAALVPNGWYLSFAVLMDKSSPWNNQGVDFSKATVAVTAKGGAAVQVYSVKWANDGMGIPNHLQWKCNGLQVGVQYQVAVGNVWFKGSPHQYQYGFLLQ